MGQCETDGATVRRCDGAKEIDRGGTVRGTVREMRQTVGETLNWVSNLDTDP